LIAIIILLSSQMSVYADAIMGNEFLERNRGKTIPVSRQFHANGPEGYINLMEKPGSRNVLTTYENGSVIEIGSAYLHMGKYWGIQPIGHFTDIPGWVQMDQLLLFYDNIDFVNEHRVELYNFGGSLDFLFEADSFYIWKWPGSDQEKILYDNSERCLDDSAMEYNYVYIDSEDRKWVYTMIWGGEDVYGGWQPAPPPGGRAKGWICADDPGNGQIPAFNPAPKPVKWSPPEGSGIGQAQRPGLLVIIIIAAAVAIVAIALVIRMRRQKRIT